MKRLVWLAVVALVSSAAAVGSAFSAHGALTGSISTCVHQNGGAIVLASPGGCAGNSSQVDLVTPDGTVANALSLDGLSASSYVLNGTTSPGFLRFDCLGSHPSVTVSVADFGTVTFGCIETGGIIYATAEMHGSPNTFGLLTSGNAAATAGFGAPSTSGLRLTFFPNTEVFGQARTTQLDAPTVTLQASVFIDGAQGAGQLFFDVLYSVIKS